LFVLTSSKAREREKRKAGEPRMQIHSAILPPAAGRKAKQNGGNRRGGRKGWLV
jgi:hypothetical protein